MVCPVPSRSFLGKIQGPARYRLGSRGIYRLWPTSSQNRALVQKTPLVLTPARWIAFIPRRTPRSLRRRPCSILIQSNASTVALACPSARCRQFLRSTICRKSGRNIRRSTRSTSGGSLFRRRFWVSISISGGCFFAVSFKPRASSTPVHDRSRITEPLRLPLGFGWLARSPTSTFHPSRRPLQSLITLLGFHGAEGVGGDRSAHVSAARVRPAGDAFYSPGRQGKRGGAVGQEVETPLRRRA